MSRGDEDCTEYERALGLCPSTMSDDSPRMVKVYPPEAFVNTYDCFVPGEKREIRVGKVLRFILYTIITALIALIVVPTIHEFGHLAISGFEGQMVWNFSDLTNIRIYAIVIHTNFLTYVGGVLFELSFAILLGLLATTKKSLVLSVLAVAFVASPIGYMTLYLLDMAPLNNDFQHFAGFHWGIFLVLLAIALFVNIKMVVRNVRYGLDYQGMLCVP